MQKREEVSKATSVPEFFDALFWSTCNPNSSVPANWYIMGYFYETVYLLSKDETSSCM